MGEFLQQFCYVLTNLMVPKQWASKVPMMKKAGEGVGISVDELKAGSKYVPIYVPSKNLEKHHCKQSLFRILQHISHSLFEQLCISTFNVVADLSYQN